MRAEIQIENLDRFRTHVSETIDRLQRPTRFMEQAAIVLRRTFAEHFNTEGASTGTPWEPLAPSTIAQKQRLFEEALIRGRIQGIRARLKKGQDQAGSMPGILIRTGALKDSVARRGFRGNIHRVSSDGRELTLGSNLPYAGIHNQGGRGPYVIAPKSKGFLAWYGIKRDGRPGWIFTRKPVLHPPAKPRPFLVITDKAWIELQELARQFADGDMPEGGE